MADEDPLVPQIREAFRASVSPDVEERSGAETFLLELMHTEAADCVDRFCRMLSGTQTLHDDHLCVIYLHRILQPRPRDIEPPLLAWWNELRRHAPDDYTRIKQTIVRTLEHPSERVWQTGTELVADLLALDRGNFVDCFRQLFELLTADQTPGASHYPAIIAFRQCFQVSKKFDFNFGGSIRDEGRGVFPSYRDFSLSVLEHFRVYPDRFVSEVLRTLAAFVALGQYDHIVPEIADERNDLQERIDRALLEISSDCAAEWVYLQRSICKFLFELVQANYGNDGLLLDPIFDIIGPILTSANPHFARTGLDFWLRVAKWEWGILEHNGKLSEYERLLAQELNFLERTIGSHAEKSFESHVAPRDCRGLVAYAAPRLFPDVLELLQRIDPDDIRPEDPADESVPLHAAACLKRLLFFDTATGYAGIRQLWRYNYAQEHWTIQYPMLLLIDCLSDCPLVLGDHELLEAIAVALSHAIATDAANQRMVEAIDCALYTAISCFKLFLAPEPLAEIFDHIAAVVASGEGVLVDRALHVLLAVIREITPTRADWPPEIWQAIVDIANGSVGAVATAYRVKEQVARSYPKSLGLGLIGDLLTEVPDDIPPFEVAQGLLHMFATIVECLSPGEVREIPAEVTNRVSEFAFRAMAERDATCYEEALLVLIQVVDRVGAGSVWMIDRIMDEVGTGRFEIVTIIILLKLFRAPRWSHPIERRRKAGVGKNHSQLLAFLFAKLEFARDGTFASDHFKKFVPSVFHCATANRNEFHRDRRNVTMCGNASESETERPKEGE
jgi:hypothetical protein